jgi:hypothetical protein
LSLLEHRLAEPVQRRISPSRRLAGGNQGAIAELGAEVPRARVDDNLGRVVTREGVLPEQRIETELLGPATSTVPFSGAPTAIRPTVLATSSAAMG